MDRIRNWLATAGVHAGIIMTGATFLAGILDYGTNILSGQLLDPDQYRIFIGVMAILQVLLHLTNVGRNLVAFHVADMTARVEHSLGVGRFVRLQYRRAWWIGIASAGIMAALSPVLARWLNFPNSWPILAGSVALVMLCVRPVTDGALQGIQHFIGLGSVNVTQAFLRVVFTLAFILLGWGATGGLMGLPVATTVALLLALWLLRPQWRNTTDDQPVPSLRSRYSLSTLIGLLAYALMVNVDAILIQSRFPDIAADYAPLVTLGKINLFLPLALGMVVFPMAIERRRQGKSGRTLILLAQAAALLPGVVVTAGYFFAPDLILNLLFGDAYGSLDMVMGLVGVATTLFSMSYLWLQYALSLEENWFAFVLAIIVCLQAAAMSFGATSVVLFVGAMIAAGVIANLAGGLLLRE